MYHFLHVRRVRMRLQNTPGIDTWHSNGRDDHSGQENLTPFHQCPFWDKPLDTIYCNYHQFSTIWWCNLKQSSHEDLPASYMIPESENLGFHGLTIWPKYNQFESAWRGRPMIKRDHLQDLGSQTGQRQWYHGLKNLQTTITFRDCLTQWICWRQDRVFNIR